MYKRQHRTKDEANRITVEVDGSAKRYDKVGNVLVNVVIIGAVECNRDCRSRRLGAQCSKISGYDVFDALEVVPVSYTHLDVYKRQTYHITYRIKATSSYEVALQKSES